MVTKTFWFPLHSIAIFVYIMEINGNWNYLVSNIPQNTLLYVPQKKVSNVGLEQYDCE